MMRRRQWPMMVLLAILMLHGSSRQAEAAPPSAASTLLAQAKAASGGDAWNTLQTLDTKSQVTQGGLTGPMEEWDNVQTGAYAVRVHLGPSTDTQGYDGRSVWDQDQSGQSQVVGDLSTRQAAVDNAYRTCLAYWFPERSPAAISLENPQTANGQTFDVLRVSPQNGRPFDLWLDQSTHLIARTVESGPNDTTTTLYSDYRSVNGMMLPFQTRATNGQTQYDQVVTVQSITINRAISPARFHIPPPPPPDFQIAGGKSSAVIPFHYWGEHIYVDAWINGHGPFPTVLDTGAVNVADPDLAKKVHLGTEGALQGGGFGAKSVDSGLGTADSLRLGGVTLHHQVFYVIPLPQLGWPPLHSLVGYEIFKRFVVSIDYDRNRLTLTRPSAFHAPPGATAVPFQFHERTPEVDGSIDGIPGVFTIDTGSGASLDLLAPFVAAHHLDTRYARKVSAFSGYGVGGPIYSQMVRAGTLHLGRVTVHGPITGLTNATKGVGAEKIVAGNVGEGVLSRFNLAFDYTHQVIYFTPNRNYAKPDIYSRSGLSMLPQGSSWRVIYVVAGSPAAHAGLKIGDRVLTVNGKRPAQLLEVRTEFLAPVGTRVHLVVQSGSQRHPVTLILKDLL